MKIETVKFAGAEIQTPIDETDITSIRAKVVFKRNLENGFKEGVIVTVFLFDTNLSVDEIEKQAIERAKEFVKSVATSIE